MKKNILIVIMADLYARYGKGNEVASMLESPLQISNNYEFIVRDKMNYVGNNVKNANMLGNVPYRALSMFESIFGESFHSRYFQELMFDKLAAKKIDKKTDILYSVPRTPITFRKAKLNKIKTVLHAVELHPKYNKKLLKELYVDGHDLPSIWGERYIYKSEETLKYVDKIICHSDFSKQTYIEGGFDESDICMIPMAHTGGEGFNRLNKNDSKKIKCLFVGNFTKSKGAHLLSEAFLKLSEDIFELHVCGRIFDDMREYEIKLNKKDNVHFYGYKNPDDLYAECDVFLFPSLSDSYAKVVAEASNFSLCPVVTNIANAGIVVDRESGIIINTNSDSIVEAMNYLNKNRENIFLYGQKAKNKASILTWEKFGTDTLKILEKFCG